MSDVPWGQIAQAGVGMAGEYMSQGSEAKRKRDLQAALDAFANIPLPDLQRLIAEQQGPSAMDGVNPDLGDVQAQRDALDSLKNIYESGGLNLSDKASLNSIRNQSAAQANSGRARIADQMAATGSSNSGTELAMQLAGNEGAANRSSQQGMEVAGMAQKRALDALMQRGQMAGQMRGQDFSEKSRKAEAADMIARYNAEARSKANMYNAGLGQQQFDNANKRASGMSGQYSGLANFEGDQANHTRQVAAGVQQGIAKWGEQQSAPPTSTAGPAPGAQASTSAGASTAPASAGYYGTDEELRNRMNGFGGAY